MLPCLHRLIITGLRECGSLRDLKLFHAIGIKIGAHRETFFGNQFIAACTRLKRIDYAKAIFSQLWNPNSFVFNALIRGLHLCSAPAEAMELYRAMLRAGVCPTGFTFTDVIKASDAEFGEAIQAQAMKLGFGADVFVQTALVDLYGNSGRIMDSKKVFDGMPSRDAVSCTAMISAHARVGDMESALRVFEDMPERGTPAWNAMIAGYGCSGDVNSAASLFAHMPQRDLVSWTSMISCYSQNKQPILAIQTFEAMEAAGVAPDNVAIASLIAACADLGAMDIGRAAHCRILPGFSCMDVFVGSALVDMYAKCGSLRSSLMVFFKLRRRNLFCWNAAIEGAAAHGGGVAALRLFRLLDEQDEVQPNSVTFLSVLSACTHAGLVEEGRRVFAAMVAPEVEHYGCVVDLLARAGRLEEAMELVQSMPVEPNAAVWGALLGGCRNYGDGRIGGAVASQLIAHQPGESGHYSLFVGLYAQEQEWPQVAAIRALMKRRGVEKASPGASSIELGGMVHEFTVSGERHPDCKAVRRLLVRLHYLMRHKEQLPLG
ncbi:basic helix loop helix DNA-binding superfamily protein [Wolffia australiana]